MNPDDELRPAQRDPFAIVPAWLIGRVSPAALEVYAAMARTVDTGSVKEKRAGDWFGYLSMADYSEKVRPIKWRTWSRCLNELESVGAALLFHTRKRHGGKQGPYAFYLSPESVPMLGRQHVKEPARRDFRVFSIMVPRLADVTIELHDGRVIYADHRRTPRPRSATTVARGPGGRFMSVPVDGCPAFGAVSTVPVEIGTTGRVRGSAGHRSRPRAGRGPDRVQGRRDRKPPSTPRDLSRAHHPARSVALALAAVGWQTEIAA